MNKKNNLLIFTQVVDHKSTTLGFMHQWISKLSKVYDNLIVICLYKGEYNFPDNVKVISLGKELNKGSNIFWKRILYIYKFYKTIFSEIRNYDKVFVHMNEEYVLFGGIFWKLASKKIYMWRNHYAGSLFTKIAGKLCNKVFYTSRFSFTSKFKNGVQMPVGVDTDNLKIPDGAEKRHNSILFLARLDPSKNPDVILKALKVLKDKGQSFTASFVGGTSDKFPNFESKMHQLSKSLGLEDRVIFVGAVPGTETYKYYASHDIYINASKSGMFDKTIFEALVAGCLPITTSIDFHDIVGDEFKFKDKDAESLASKLSNAIGLGFENKRSKVSLMQDQALSKNTLDFLVNKISKEV